MKSLILLGFTMALLGCTRATSDYYYISLEHVDGIKVTKREKVQLEKLVENSEIATEYLLVRNSYTLRFSIGERSYHPHIIVSVVNNQRELFPRPRRDTTVTSHEGNICASYYPDLAGGSSMGFGWAVNCLGQGIDEVISFDVVDESGVVVAKEDIPFVVKRDGKYTLLDAI